MDGNRSGTSIRVVHLIDSLAAAGTAIMLGKVVGHMDARGFRSTVVSFTGNGDLGSEIEAQGIGVQTLGMRRRRPSPFALRRLTALLRRERPDVVQTWLYNADLLGALVCRSLRIGNLVWNVRNAHLGPGDRSLLTTLSMHGCRLLSRLPAMVISNSEAGRQFHCRFGYRARQWTIIPNGFDFTRFRPNVDARRRIRHSLGIPEHDVVVGWAGRDDPVKDVATFVRAAQRLKSAAAGIHFVMLGRGLTGASPAIARCLRSSPPPGNLHLLGAQRDVAPFMAAMDLLAVTSLSEGFPNVVGEAMGSGLPCIVTSTSGDAPHIIGDTGLVIPPRDPDALCRAILSLRPHLVARGRAARERAVARYDIGNIARLYEDVYRSLVAGPVSADDTPRPVLTAEPTVADYQQGAARPEPPDGRRVPALPRSGGLWKSGGEDEG